MDEPEAFRALYRSHYPAVCRSADMIARQPAGDGPAVEAEAAIAARRRALITALTSLRECDRELLPLRYWEELPARELAVAAGISRVAVRRRLHRAERRLRTAWLRIEADGAPNAERVHPTRTLTDPDGGTDRGA